MQTVSSSSSSKKDHDDENNVNLVVAWQNLTRWIHAHGGYVHPDLEFRVINGNSNHRGVFAKSDIAVGQLLIRLPSRLAIHGNDSSRFPYTYQYASSTDDVEAKNEDSTTATSTFERAASSWLRCLAAYYQSQDSCSSSSSSSGEEEVTSNIDMAAYFASLPCEYETVSAWTSDELKRYLAGTTFCNGGGGMSWHQASDETVLRERYTQQIRPYLVHCKLLPPPTSPPPAILGTNKKDGDDEDEFQRFETASQCMSTRCFHLSKQQQQQQQHDTIDSKPATAASRNTTSDDYTGPFLLPIIDLLNHASSHEEEACVTSLVQCNDAFTMTAERPIAAGQEVLHSYGNDLNAGQFLQTFGFVPISTMERCIQRMTTKEDAAASSIASLSLTTRTWSLTPAFLSKESVLEACWSIVEDDDDYPNRLARTMKDNGMDDDETWAVHVDKTRNTDFIPDSLLVSHPCNTHREGNNKMDVVDESVEDGTAASSSILTDELVTLACIPFLPKCAYAEVAQSLLGPEILQDYFLGKLVCTSLLKALRQKLALYEPIPTSMIPLSVQSDFKPNDDKGKGDDEDNDVRLLRQLLDYSRNNTATTDNSSGTVATTRLMYGLTVRLEEKLSLLALRREVMTIIASLDDDNDDIDMELEFNSKRQKL